MLRLLDHHLKDGKLDKASEEMKQQTKSVDPQTLLMSGSGNLCMSAGYSPALNQDNNQQMVTGELTN